MNGAIYVKNSENSKISGSERVDSTYASIEATCPSSCSLKNDGCYAQLSFVGITSNRLNKEAVDSSALEVARAEAKAIDNAYKGKRIPFATNLRIHVAGDSRTVKGSKLINSAVGRWKKRGGANCWSYTHAWKNVPRSTWSNVSMLASVSSVKEAEAAREKGYAPAIVVGEFTNSKAFTLPGSDVKFIPCPAQTEPGGKRVGCSDCKLCFNADRLYKGNFGIAFEAHGVRKNNIKKRLNVIQ
jgi:hypothetical protein